MAYTLLVSIEPLYEALIGRFGPREPELLSELDKLRYTVQDVIAKKDIIGYFPRVLRVTGQLKWPQVKGLVVAYGKIQGESYGRDIDVPNSAYRW